jgi:hypothetical protein
VSFDCEVEKFLNFFSLFAPVFIDEIDNILADILGLHGVLNLVEALS